MPTTQIYSADQISEKFQQRFREKCKVFRAPGRVNLIGEHTDYNQGFVLPAAIDFSCWVAVAARDDKKLCIYSENFSEEIAVDLSSSNSWPRKGWAAYPLGVGWALKQAGFPLQSCNLSIVGNVPLGSGLSSSAAIEVATALALLDVSGSALEKTK